MARQSLLFLLLFMCLQAASESAVFNKDKKITPMPCRVIRPFDGQLVRAFSETPVTPTEGCVTNATQPSPGAAEVHVISYHGNDSGQDLELILRDFHEEGFAKPFIVIVSSNVPTHWQIRLGRHVQDPGRHIFVVAKTSGIRFANKHLSARPGVSKVRSLPVGPGDLLQWTLEKYGAVTSLTAFDSGNSFTLTIGQASASASSTSTTSPSSSTSSSQCNIQTSAPPSPFLASGIERQQNDVAGCLVDSRQYADSDLNYAYVVELKNEKQGKPAVVDVDLRLGWNATEKVEFWLVLKSASHVRWRVHSKHSESYIIFVSNDDVDDKGVHIESTAVRRETLEESGAELLHWVQVHLGRVGMYVSLSDATRIRLTLPQIATQKSKPIMPTPPSSVPNWGREQTLKRALRTSCDVDEVTVAIDNNVLEMFGIRSSTVSLSDPRCRAEKNNTHVYITSARDACGTRSLRTPDGALQYVNTLVLQTTTTVSEGRRGYGSFHDDETLEEDGSGMDVFSGSGDDAMATDLVLDDEDLSLQPTQIPFACSLVAMETTTGRQAEPMFQLELFHSFLYLKPYARFPVDLPDVTKRVYLQATVTSDPRLQANFESCWLSSLTESSDKYKYMLLQNGCGIDNTISWNQMDAAAQSERLSFTLENFVRETSGSQGVFLKCQMTVCCLESPCPGHRYPQCASQRPGCSRHRGRHHNTPSRLVVLGPILLPQSTEYDVRTTVSDVVETAAPGDDRAGVGGGGGAGERVQEQQEHVVIQGLDSGTVIGIAFAAFIIGVLMMGALWFIHTHSGSIFTSGPFKRSLGNRGSSETEADYGETTPGSSAPISA